jgi:hypothetical protein
MAGDKNAEIILVRKPLAKQPFGKPWKLGG